MFISNITCLNIKTPWRCRQGPSSPPWGVISPRPARAGKGPRAVYYRTPQSSSSVCAVSQQHEKFLLQQSRKFLLKSVKLAG